VYGVFLMPEIFNFSLVFLAYCLWRSHEGTNPGGQWGRKDVAAAALLGLATYSKPLPIAFLVIPLVASAWMAKQWKRGFVLGAVAVAVTALFFVLTAAVSGEFNYQGGRDRRTFYARFPFATPDATWEQMTGNPTTTDGTAAAAVLTSSEAPRRFIRNVKYFLVGRHFGFVPYFFPGVVAIALWLLSPARRDRWRQLIFVSFLLATAGLLLVLPFTWSGGGGPPANRYVLSAYPVLFFLTPPLMTAVPGLVAWIGGALFTAKMLVSPFTAAKFTWELTERGLARRLPVELTMAQDLPVMLAQPLRGRVQYGHDPFLLLYFLDQNSWPPEPDGMWVSGAGRSEIIVRSVDPIDHLAVEAQSPIRTRLTASLGSDEVGIQLEPNQIVTFDVPAAGIPGQFGFVYLMRVQSSEGFVPHLRDGNGDYRNLGAQLRFRPVTSSGETSSR
jgi:hypothetical protein